MKKISLILCYIVIFCVICSSLCGCENKSTVAEINTKKYSSIDFKDSEISENVVIENSNFALAWDAEKFQVSFQEKSSGEIYGTMPQEAKTIIYDEDGIPKKNNPQIESPIIVHYYDPNVISETSTLASIDAIKDGNVYVKQTENGLCVTYDFVNQEISIPVYYTICDDSFKISINPEEISDNGVNFVTGVSVAPFLCSLKNDSSDGYLFLPDGSGAIIKPKTISASGSLGSSRVYGDDLTVQTYELPSFTKNINLPVYGMKKGEHAILGIITSATEQAYINWNIGSQNVGYSTVYPFFRIRGYNLLEKPEGYSAADKFVRVFDEYITTEKIEVTFHLLSGNDANYSGMAKEYRNYLIDNNMLSDGNFKQTSGVFKILGGAERKVYTFGVPHAELCNLTTINQTKEILKCIRDKTDGNIVASLIGFGESGLDAGKVAGGFKIASSFGKKNDVKDLSKYCENSNISLFMDFDLIAFSKSGYGYSTSRDSAKLPDGQSIYLSTYNNVTRNKNADRYMLLSRNSLHSALKKAVNSIDKYDIKGISLESLGKTVYSDYSSDNARVSSGMANQVTSLFDNVIDEYELLTNAANAYAVGLSDYVIEVPTTSSKYDFTFADVPFFEMVFRGYVSMSGQSINLAANNEKEILRCVESGLSPTYTLIYGNNNLLIDSKFASIHSASFFEMKDDIISTINQLSEVNKKIGNAKIVSHELREDGLRITTFENGIKVAINETDVTITFDGNSIKPNFYIVLEG